VGKHILAEHDAHVVVGHKHALQLLNLMVHPLQMQPSCAEGILLEIFIAFLQVK
jgi:hypothetical protein